MNYIKDLPPRWHIIGKDGLCCEGACIKNNINNGNGSIISSTATTTINTATTTSTTYNTSGLYSNDDDDDMKGPSDTTNWIVKGQILSGEYPGNVEDVIHFKTLSTLLDSGIRVFVCLQEEQELKKFRPYRDDILKLAKEKGIDETKITFIHFPMEDGGIAENNDELSDLIERLLQLLSSDTSNKIYLHCWAGRGRTGIISACLLGRLYQVSGLEALRRTQACYQQRIIGYGESPEYHPQKMQVIKYLRQKNNEQLQKSTELQRSSE